MLERKRRSEREWRMPEERRVGARRREGRWRSSSVEKRNPEEKAMGEEGTSETQKNWEGLIEVAFAVVGLGRVTVAG